MRDQLNEALKQLDTAAFMYERGTDVRDHIDRARSQVVSALLAVLKKEAADLRERIAEDEEP